MGNTSLYGNRALIRIGGRITIFAAFLTLPVLPMSSNRTQEEMSGLVDNPRWNGFNNRNREISNMFVDRRTMGQEEALREEKS
jgi:hypothetical protein